MSLSRSAKLLLVGGVFSFAAFLTLGEIASELLLMTSGMESKEEVRALDFGSLIYFGQAFIIFLITAIITLILGGIFYKIDKNKGIPFVSRKNESVSIKRQTIYAIIPILDAYAAYKVKKLIMYIVIMIVIGMVIGVSSELTGFDYAQSLPTPADEIVWEFILIPLAVFLIRKWSKDWNQQMAQLTS